MNILMAVLGQAARLFAVSFAVFVVFFLSVDRINQAPPEWKDTINIVVGLVLLVGCGIPLLAAAIIVYMAPSAVAGGYKHQHSQAIFAFNILLGWTFVGWALALVWALTAAGPIEIAPAAPASPSTPMPTTPVPETPMDSSGAFAAMVGGFLGGLFSGRRGPPHP